jgi:hypothetical protein
VAVAGQGDTALRLLGLGIGAALLGALWFNARAAAAVATVPLASLALLGFNSAVLDYGDAVRGYGLGSVLVVLAFGLAARALLRPTRGAGVAAWLAGLVAAHCLLQSSALLLGIALAAALVAWRRAGQRRLAVAVLAGGLAIAASLLPYAGPLRAARDWDMVVRWPVDLGQLADGLRQALGSPWQAAAWLAALLLAALAGATSAIPAAPESPAVRSAGGAAAAGATPANAAAGDASGTAGDAIGAGGEARFARCGARDQAVFCAVALVLAMVSFGGFLWLLGYAPRPWYYLPPLALAATALDLLLAQRGRPVRGLLLAGTVALAACLLWPAAAATRSRQTNVDQLAALVEEGAARGDLVLVNPWQCGISFRRCYHGAAAWTTLPAIADHRFHRYDLLKAKMISPHPIDDVIDLLGRTLRGGHRVWLVGGVGLSRSRAPVIPLPPAPRSRWGWYDLPYTISWSRQAGAYLQAHTVQWQGMRLSGGDPIDPLEHLPLLVAYGWK